MRVGEPSDKSTRFFSGKQIARKIGDDTAIRDLKSRTKIIEGTRNSDWQTELASEVDAERFAEAFGFIVTRSRSRAGNVAAIVFCCGYLIWRRVAVNLAG